MFCQNCGKEVDDNAYVCLNCGAKLSDERNSKKSNSNGMAIAGFICSFFIPLLGLIFGIIGLNKANNRPDQKGKGLSIAAIAIAGATFLINYWLFF